MSFLKKFDKSTKEGQMFRNHIPMGSMLDLIDDALESKNETYIKEVESKILKCIGKPAIVNMLVENTSENPKTTPVQQNHPEKDKNNKIEPPTVENNIKETDEKETDKKETQEIETSQSESQLKPTFQLTLGYGNKSMSEMGNMKGEGSYEESTEVECVATPNEGYKFDGWKLNGRGELITDNPMTIEMNSNKTYKAYFSIV